MCRSIKQLRPTKGSEDPFATSEEIEAAARQFVKKVSGFQRPAKHNAEAFDLAIADISAATRRLLATLELK